MNDSVLEIYSEVANRVVNAQTRLNYLKGLSNQHNESVKQSIVQEHEAISVLQSLQYWISNKFDKK